MTSTVSRGRRLLVGLAAAWLVAGLGGSGADLLMPIVARVVLVALTTGATVLDSCNFCATFTIIAHLLVFSRLKVFVP